jgi:hypothetical protein
MFTAAGASGYGSCVGSCAYTEPNILDAMMVMNIFFILVYFKV